MRPPCARRASVFVKMEQPPIQERLARALADHERLDRELFVEDTLPRFVANLDWSIVRANASLARTLAYKDEIELSGTSLIGLTSNDPILQKLLAVTRAEGRAGPVEFQLERADGTLIDVACSVAGSFDEKGVLHALRGHVTDITERKRLETRLIGAERMEVIGRLAGGLAHDFNNLLTVISGNSEKLLEKLPSDDALRGSALAINEASARAASMTQQLLAYSRRQVFDLKPLSLDRLVDAAQPWLAEILGSHIAIRLSLAPALPLVNADARQIEHVIANLAHNARDAMPSGGTLTLKVDAVDIGESAPRGRQWLRPGRYVRLLVADTGHGMDHVARSYAFQPFFTTRRMGSGRGLGLATVYGIVKQSNGFVWVESEPDRGATFTILFPALPSEGSVRAESDAPVARETILVVEADLTFRRFVRDALARRGYHVLEADGGGQALHVFAAYPSRIHLLLADSDAVTDEGIPLAPRLQVIDPRLQSFVMMSGSDLAGGRRALPTMPAIQKPFTLIRLAHRIREVLDSGEGRGPS